MIRFNKEQIPDFSSPHIFEPLLQITREFSLLYQNNPPESGGLRFLGLSHQTVDHNGQWESSTSAPKPASGLPPEEAQLIANTVLPAAKKQIHRALTHLLETHQYQGPICLDSFFYLQGGQLHWNKVSEINARWTMGRLAHQFRLKLCPNRSLTLSTMPATKARQLTPSKHTILLNNPQTAHYRTPMIQIQEKWP